MATFGGDWMWGTRAESQGYLRGVWLGPLMELLIKWEGGGPGGNGGDGGGERCEFSPEKVKFEVSQGIQVGIHPDASFCLLDSKEILLKIGILFEQHTYSYMPCVATLMPQTCNFLGYF